MRPRLALVFCLLAPLVLSQDAPTKGLRITMGKGRPARSIPAWKGTIRNTIERKGTFIPADAAELKLDLRAYRGRSGGELRIVEIASHGSFVNEGDVIARLDTRGIDKRIESDRMALERAAMGLRHAEDGFRMKAEKDAEALDRAEREAGRAAKKLRGYREHEKKFTEESERLAVQGRKHRIEDQKDELEQLEKMYSEDELVDATEEIVLKRSRRNFARSQQSQDLAEERRLYNKEWYQPWREEDLETDAASKGRSLERLNKSQAMGREKAEADLAQKRWELAKQKERFADLERDRVQFVIRAPRRGILLHGARDAAPWDRLRTDSVLRNRVVFATVADPRRYEVSTDIAESDLFQLKSGTAAEIVPTAAPGMKLLGRLEVEYLPMKGNLFKATVHLGKAKVSLRPGLSCKVNVIVAEERDAVLVPKAALIEKDGATFVRCSKTAGGPVEERKVVAGVSDGKNVAIREGIEVGEYVVVPPPAPGQAQGRR